PPTVQRGRVTRGSRRMAEEAPTPPEAGGQAAPSLTLLHRLQANEPAAWDFALKLYGPLVRVWCARLGVWGADAEDVAQEVFKAAVTGLAGFRRDRPGDSFRGWLYAVTRNLARRHQGRAARGPSAGGGTGALQLLQQIPEPEEPTEAEVASDRATLLRTALELVRGQFEDKTWQAFRLTVLEERLPDEVAPLLGISPAPARKYK